MIKTKIVVALSLYILINCHNSYGIPIIDPPGLVSTIESRGPIENEDFDEEGNEDREQHKPHAPIIIELEKLSPEVSGGIPIRVSVTSSAHLENVRTTYMTSINGTVTNIEPKVFPTLGVPQQVMTEELLVNFPSGSDTRNLYVLVQADLRALNQVIHLSAMQVLVLGSSIWQPTTTEFPAVDGNSHTIVLTPKVEG